MNEKPLGDAPSTILGNVPAAADPTTRPANAQRRRVLLAGLAAAPVILTLRSRSVFSAAAPPLSCTIVESILAGSSQHAGVELRPQDQECNKGGN